jgi:hypothetical protein
MGKKSRESRVHVELTARWGNDDAESSIKMSRSRWMAIQDGAEFVTVAWGWYEGRRFPVVWRFARGEVSIDGEDGMQCVVDGVLCDLFVQLAG